MLAKIFACFLLLKVVWTAGMFSVFSPSETLSFHGNKSVDENILVDIVKVSLGLDASNSHEWSGLQANPFDLPKSVYLIHVTGLKNINLDNKWKNFELSGDISNELFDTDTYKNKETTTVSAKFSVNEFNSNDDDQTNFAEIINRLSNIQKPTDLTIISLTPINSEKIYSLNSINSENSFQRFLQYLTDAPKRDNFVIYIISEFNEHGRLKREANTKEDKADNLNLAVAYSKDYPVIFNIILWFGVIIAFSMLAICYVIATMDPGRDSIIYRMTSTRMKKDN